MLRVPFFADFSRSLFQRLSLLGPPANVAIDQSKPVNARNYRRGYVPATSKGERA